MLFHPPRAVGAVARLSAAALPLRGGSRGWSSLCCLREMQSPIHPPGLWRGCVCSQGSGASGALGNLLLAISSRVPAPCCLLASSPRLATWLQPAPRRDFKCTPLLFFFFFLKKRFLYQSPFSIPKYLNTPLSKSLLS